jgi:hypothetical protein
MTPKQFHALVMSFPEVAEGISHGRPSYNAFGKFFTRLNIEVSPQDPSAVVGEVDFDERDMLCEAEPETFYFTDHYRAYTYMLVRIASIDAKRIKFYLDRRWRKCAPKKWLKAWEAGKPLPPVAKKAPPKKRKAR